MRRLEVRTQPAEVPADLVDALARPDGVTWIHERDGFVAWGEAARVECRGPARFAAARAAMGDLVDDAEVDDPIGAPGTGLVAFGSFTFDEHSAGSALVVPSVVIGRRDGRSWITRISGATGDPVPEAVNDRVRYAGSTISEVAWLEAVDRATSVIRSGDAEKVVLARDVHVWSKRAFDLRPIARRLAIVFPQCYTFMMDGIIGATPELLARRMGQTVESLVLAGSARRGRTPAEDEDIGAGLLASVKDGQEHRPAVEHVARVLDGVTRDLKVTADPFLLRLDNVQHLATEFGGELHDGFDALDLVGALHPTPAVCGTPADRAAALISELEGMDRSRYAGPVGWMDARGDGEWGIALRCGEFHEARGRLFAGAGIVADSVPEAELEETRIKLAALQNALEAGGA